MLINKSMKTNEGYVKRRFGILGTAQQTEFNSIPLTESQTNITPDFYFKFHEKYWFKVISQICILTFYLHILIQIEFRSSLSPSFPYFEVIEAICLAVLILRLVLNLLNHGWGYISISRVIESLGLSISVVVLIIELAESDFIDSITFKIGSILRFFPLFVWVVHLKFHKTNDSRFSVSPFKTRSERLIAVLRYLREIDFIKNDPSIDSQLEWAIKVVCNQTLYNVDIISENKDQEEIIKWALVSNQTQILPQNHNSNHSSGARSFEIDSYLKNSLLKVDKLSFNIFELQEISHHNELSLLCPYLLNSYDLFSIEQIDRSKFDSFIKQIQAGYNSEIPYHNSTHAADVLQAVHYFIKTCKCREFINLTSSDIAISLISAAIHDFQHQGFNNSFLINSSDYLAVLYNDRSVLENHHVASSFKLLEESGNNFFAGMQRETVRDYRNRMIEMVLATDFSKHFKELGKFKLVFGKNADNASSKGTLMKMLIHAADISNSMRTWKVYHKWAHKVLDEFFMQGDKERDMGLKISPLCDRHTVSFSKSQIGFIDLFIDPIVKTLKELMPRFEKCEKNVVENRKLLVEMSNE